MMYGPANIVQLQLDADACCNSVAWCRTGNLLAVPVTDTRSSQHEVVLLDSEAEQVSLSTESLALVVCQRA